MDRAGADLDAAVASIREHAVPLVVQLPIGAEDSFVGVVDLLHLRALVWTDFGMSEEPVPEALRRRRTGGVGCWRKRWPSCTRPRWRSS